MIHENICRKNNTLGFVLLDSLELFSLPLYNFTVSAITICFGFKLPKAGTPTYAIYIMIVYVLYVMVIDIIFELIECLNKKEKLSK